MSIQLDPFGRSQTFRIRWLPEISSELLPRFMRLARDLKLARRARAEGAENRPERDDRELDAAQREIGTAVTEGVNLLRQFLHDQLHRATERIQARLPAHIDPEIALVEARAAVQEAKHSHREQLANLSLEEHRKRRQLKKFRADHGLSHDASYASHPIIPFSILFVMIAVEAAANAVLFAKTNPMGYAGGAFQALLFGAINVALAFMAGFFGLRLAGHTKRWVAALGWALLFAMIGGGLYWNLKIAHYRDLLERTSDTDFVDNSNLLPSFDWIALASIESCALLILGIVVFVAAMMEGRGGRSGFSDPYWAYRGIDLAHREAEAVYRSAKDAYRTAVRAGIDAAIHAEHTGVAIQECGPVLEVDARAPVEDGITDLHRIHLKADTGSSLPNPTVTSAPQVRKPGSLILSVGSLKPKFRRTAISLKEHPAAFSPRRPIAG